MSIGYEIFTFSENKGFLEIFFHANKLVMFLLRMMGIPLLNIDNNKNCSYVFCGSLGAAYLCIIFTGLNQRRNESLPKLLCVVRLYKMAPILRTCGEFRVFEFDFLRDEALIRDEYT